MTELLLFDPGCTVTLIKCHKETNTFSTNSNIFLTRLPLKSLYLFFNTN